jgi:aspartyl-tRNA(Asn)/glutamyl-tRNA(Gln) amidotransferase subunit A
MGKEAIGLSRMTIGTAVVSMTQGTFSARDLIEAVLQEIEPTEAAFHAYAHVDPTDARRQADQADRERSSGRSGAPLLGVPLGVKDLFDVAGMPTAAGCPPAQFGAIATRDAGAVSRWRRAGAVIVGKHETNQFGMGICPPPTRNAWDPSRYPGGSTAGGGVSVAMTTSLGALGSDGWGSVRKPAALNGVVGFKPTHGAVDRTGVVPGMNSLADTGVLAKTCADARLLAAVLLPSSVAGRSSDGPPAPGGRWGRVSQMWADLDDDVATTCEQAVATCVRSGVEIVDLDVPSFDEMSRIGSTIGRQEAYELHRDLLEDPLTPYPPDARSALREGGRITDSELAEARRERAAMKTAWRQLVRRLGIDLVVSPTTPRPAIPLAAMDLGRDIADYCRFTSIANTLGLPAITVPAGLSGDGLPIGVQLIGRPGDDMFLLSAAESVEGLLGPTGRQSPAARKRSR